MPLDIQFLNELVERFAAATKANNQTPGLRGSTVHLKSEDADEVCVVGDLHGNRTHFNKVRRAVDLANNPRRHLVLQEVLHGGPTYDNGGCMSHMLLEDVAALKVKHPAQVHFLLSNHELSECMTSDIKKAGISQLHLLALGLQHAYGPAADRIAECYHEFILSCPLAVRTGNGVFISHSLPAEDRFKRFDPRVLGRKPTKEDFLEGGSAHLLVWGRNQSPEFVRQFCDKVKCTAIVNGHQPTGDGYMRPNDHQVILDASGTNCYLCRIPLSGSLTSEDVEARMQKL